MDYIIIGLIILVFIVFLIKYFKNKNKGKNKKDNKDNKDNNMTYNFMKRPAESGNVEKPTIVSEDEKPYINLLKTFYENEGNWS